MLSNGRNISDVRTRECDYTSENSERKKKVDDLSPTPIKMIRPRPSRSNGPLCYYYYYYYHSIIRSRAHLYATLGASQTRRNDNDNGGGECFITNVTLNACTCRTALKMI